MPRYLTKKLVVIIAYTNITHKGKQVYARIETRRSDKEIASVKFSYFCPENPDRL
jgi:hypothetical protein